MLLSQQIPDLRTEGLADHPNMWYKASVSYRKAKNKAIASSSMSSSGDITASVTTTTSAATSVSSKIFTNTSGGSSISISTSIIVDSLNSTSGKDERSAVSVVTEEKDNEI